MLLSQLSLTLNDVDLGSIDAESDTRLADYFVTTPYVAHALQGKRTQFLGRKGSGKSALFGQLPRLVADSGGTSQSVRLITPDHYAWSALKEYREQGLLAEQAHTNAWKLTLCIEVCGALLAETKDWSSDSKAALDRIRQFLSDNFGTVSPGLLKTATSMITGLRAFNFSAFGFGVGFNKEVTADQALTPAVAEELLKLARTALCEHRVVLGIDRLDDSWDGSDEARSLLVGLLKAAKELNDECGTNYSDAGLRIDVFLRSDIYDSLRFDDKDKHRAMEQDIVWTPELLQEMVQRRIPENVEVHELFETGDMRGSISPFNYIVKRTFLRPREVLQFLEECINQAGRQETVIMKNDVRAAEERYSGWKVSDLKQEYAKVFPHFDTLLECFRQEVHRYDRLADLEVLLRRKVPQLVEDNGVRNLMETLFECSVIGVRLSDAGSTRYKSEDMSLVLPQAGAVYVHQALHRGLSIRETRRSAEEAAVGNPLDRLSVELYAMMMSSLPIQDLTFLAAQPTPIDVLEAATYAACAEALGKMLQVDVTGSLTTTIIRPNIVADDRFQMKSQTYLTLRNDMEHHVRTRGFTVEEYVKAERRASD